MLVSQPPSPTAPSSFYSDTRPRCVRRSGFQTPTPRSSPNKSPVRIPSKKAHQATAHPTLSFQHFVNLNHSLTFCNCSRWIGWRLSLGDGPSQGRVSTIARTNPAVPICLPSRRFAAARTDETTSSAYSTDLPPSAFLFVAVSKIPGHIPQEL